MTAGSGKPGSVMNKAVSQFFDELQWKPTCEYNEKIDHYQYNHVFYIFENPYVLYVDVLGRDMQIMLSVYTPFEVPVDRILELSRLLNGINFKHRIGRFAIFDDGNQQRVQCRAGIDVRDGTLTQNQVAGLMDGVCGALEDYADIIYLAAYSTLTQDELWQKYEIEKAKRIAHEDAELNDADLDRLN